MKLKTIIMMFCTITLSGCQSKENIQVTYKSSQIESATRPQLISQQEINFKLQDQDSFRYVVGKISLYKISDSCQIEKTFIYSKSIAVTYQYIFKKKKLVSSHTLVPDEFINNKINHIWNDPEDKNILESFNEAKQVFSSKELDQCN